MSEPVAHLRYYTDKHIPKAVAIQLRNRGIDTIRCEDVGLGDASDLTHLEYATSEGRAVIKKDADFIRLDKLWHAEGQSHAGIIICKGSLQGERAIGQIVNDVVIYHELIERGVRTAASDITDKIVYVR
jgi:predicted nuclease of predicted toxin-antitoxin system